MSDVPVKSSPSHVLVGQPTIQHDDAVDGVSRDVSDCSKTSSTAVVSSEVTSYETMSRSNEDLTHMPAGQQFLTIGSTRSIDNPTNQVLELLERYNQSPSMTEREALRNEIIAAVLHRPELVESVPSACSEGDRRSFAQMVLVSFVYHGLDEPDFTTHGNFIRIVELCELVSPQSERGDIIRLLRLSFYDNESLQFLGITIGERVLTIDDDLWSLIDACPLKEAWQIITAPDDEQMDIAHSLVALDASETKKGFGGDFRAWLFTSFGDSLSHILSKLGINKYGDLNPCDARGNRFGRQLAISADEFSGIKLSVLLRINCFNERFLT